MYTILIVDDEPRQRRVLGEIIKRNKSDFNILIEKNGEEALQIFNKTHIDIIITDIKMPIMDGLELIENLKDRLGNTRVIFLSGYSEFDYAKKALKFGVFDYIVKPFDEAQIMETVDRALLSLEQAKRNVYQAQEMEQQINDIFPFYLENKCNRWVNGTLCETDILRVKKYISFNSKILVMITDISDQDSFWSKYSLEEKDEIKNNIKYWIESILRFTGASYSFYMNEYDYYLVSIIGVEKDDYIKSQEFLEKLQDCINIVNKSYGMHVTIGIGRIFDDLVKGAKKSLYYARQAIEYRLYLGENKVISYDSLKIKTDKYLTSTYTYDQDIISFIKCSDKDKAVGLLEEYFTEAVKNGYVPPESLIDTVTNTIVRASSIIESFMLNENYNSFVLNIEDRIKNSRSYQEMRMNAKSCLEDIFSTYAGLKDNKVQAVMEQCIKYIKEHYKEDLSLDMVAKKFFFNSSYFSSFFKNNVGVNYSEFLLSIRMDKAKELLGKTDMKVFEIAEQAGYRNLRYFNRVFKKEFNMTPFEYRHMSKKDFDME